MERVDVLVAGAGPAGLATATRIAAAGHDVLVVERQASVAEHVRTSGMTAMRTVRRIDAPAATHHPIDRLRFLGPASEGFVPTSGLVTVLDVRAFYRWLASRAEAAGARIETGTTAESTSTIRSAGGDRRRIEARVVVDATGYRATVSRRAGLHPGFDRFGVGVELELAAPQLDDATAVLIVGRRYAPSGYGWSFPCGGGRVRLGVGLHHRDVRDDPAVFVRSLLDDQAVLRLGLDDAQLVETHRGLIPAEHPGGAIVGDGLLAVGDAAAQATLVAGEGIRVAIESGELAADVIVRALARGDVSREALSPYETESRRRLRGQAAVGARLNRRLATTSDDARWDRRIADLESMPPDLVVALLQSQLPVGRVVAWASRRPFAAGRLMRSIFG